MSKTTTIYIGNLSEYQASQVVEILKTASDDFVAGAYNFYVEQEFLEDYKDRGWSADYKAKCRQIYKACLEELHSRPVEFNVNQAEYYEQVELLKSTTQEV